MSFNLGDYVLESNAKQSERFKTFNREISRKKSGRLFSLCADEVLMPILQRLVSSEFTWFEHVKQERVGSFVMKRIVEYMKHSNVLFVIPSIDSIFADSIGYYKTVYVCMMFESILKALRNLIRIASVFPVTLHMIYDREIVSMFPMVSDELGRIIIEKPQTFISLRIQGITGEQINAVFTVWILQKIHNSFSEEMYKEASESSLLPLDLVQILNLCMIYDNIDAFSRVIYLLKLFKVRINYTQIKQSRRHSSLCRPIVCFTVSSNLTIESTSEEIICSQECRMIYKYSLSPSCLILGNIPMIRKVYIDGIRDTVEETEERVEEKAAEEKQE
jgi:hypothetical protein